MVIENYITVRKGEDNMSNASDIKELQENIGKLTGGLMKAFEQVSFDYQKLQTMHFALLQELDFCEIIECSKCRESVMRPLLKALPLEDGCPMCGESLSGYETPTQSTIEDWDNGVGADESE